MKLILIALVVALVVGLSLGGRISNLAAVSFRWVPLAVVGLALQLLTPSEKALADALLILSFLLLALFTILNRQVAGFALVLAGLFMNFLVIGVNHGMPVTRYALESSGQGALLTDLIENGGAKHHLAGPDDRLLFLGDVIPIPPPVAQAVSAGDIVAYVGVGYVIVAGMLPRKRREATLEAGDDAGAVERA
jgi:Family of unknown function (DUF5317)